VGHRCPCTSHNWREEGIRNRCTWKAPFGRSPTDGTKNFGEKPEKKVKKSHSYQGRESKGSQNKPRPVRCNNTAAPGNRLHGTTLNS